MTAIKKIIERMAGVQISLGQNHTQMESFFSQPSISSATNTEET
jgi:hypothetical protein